MLVTVPPLAPAELQVLDQIDDLRRRLRFALSPSARWHGLIRRATLAHAIRGSNTLEGYQVSPDDALAVAVGEEPVEADECTAKVVVGYHRAMKYVLRLSVDPTFRYSSDLLRSLHYLMLEHDPEKSPGQWRTGDFFLRGGLKHEIVHYGPDPGEVRGLVEELMSNLNAEQQGAHNVVRAAMAHLNLVMIHPFSDGNARMAGALQTLVLARSGMIEPALSSIEEYLGSNRPEYEAALAEVRGSRWDPGRNARPWIRFCLTAHYRQAITLLQRIERVRAVWERAEHEVVKRKLPERMILALADAMLGYRVRNVTYRKAACISEYLASRDLKALVKAGLLIPRGERRGRSYGAANSLEYGGAATKAERAVADPFLALRSSV